MSEIEKHLSLDGDWEFAYQKQETEPIVYEISMPVPGYWDDCEERLTLAKFWSRDKKINPDYQPFTMPIGSANPPDMSLPYLVGIGRYRKNFQAPMSWKEKSIILHIGGVTMEAWIWLNGTLLAYHEGHLTPFAVPLSENIKPGQKNELVIAVSNSRQDRIGCSIRGNKGKSGGITGSVWLEVTGRIRMADCFVHTDKNQKCLFWQVQLAQTTEAEREATYIEWEIFDTGRRFLVQKGCVSAEEESVAWSSSTEGLMQWSDKNPQIYQLHLVLKQREEILDELWQGYGMRFLEISEGNIFLNQQKIFLRGATDHAYFPKFCTVPRDVAYYRDILKLLKSYGFNWIRFHTWVPPVQCLDAADELGMLLQIEAVNGFSEREWLDMIFACRRHPSVIIYCCGNEVRMDEAFLSSLQKMAEHLHRLIPDVLFNPMEGLRGIEYDIDDKHTGFEDNCFRHDRLQQLESFSDVLAPHGRHFSYHSLAASDEDIEKNLRQFHRPCLIHEAGINDTYLNLDLEKRYEGTRIGTKLYSETRKYVQRMGMLDRTPVYYRNSCFWMHQVVKYSLENLRRNDKIKGYDLLGVQDCHWHRSGYACGFLNEFYELKLGFSRDDILTFNSESVLLAKVGKERNIRPGQQMSLQVYVSLYGDSSIQSGTLFYELAGENGKQYASGSISVADIPTGGVTGLGTVKFVVPRVEKAEHVLLKLQLYAEECQLHNSWDYWIFPVQVPYFDSGNHPYRSIEELDEQMIQAVLDGETILLFGCRPFTSVNTSFQIMTAGRAQGLNATVIEDHPLTRKLPQEGFCDWQMQPMLDGGQAVVFEQNDIPFHPIIEMCSGYKIIRRQAALFEFCIGKGKLLVCSLNMQNQDAGTQYMKVLLEHYAASDVFCPTESVSPKWLFELCREKRKLDIDFTTDEGYDAGGHVKTD